jgi:phenylalanyl-tRNA synthetase beta chain
MKLSYKWVNDLLPQQLTISQMSDILTAIGLEVEEVSSSSPIPGNLAGVVIGKVVSCAKHPNADKLSVTTVDIGNGTIAPIVCGAPNVAVGQTVVVATVGATLYPSKGEPFEIKKAKIRGEVSEGMICAEDEIGLGESHEGIIVINENVAPGTPAATYYKIPEADYTIEVGLTPNRMDAMSHMGVAKDICAYLANMQHSTVTQVVPVTNINWANAPTQLPNIEILTTQNCPRYIGVLLNNITVADSPAWLKEKLTTIGVKSINNVVDITNYVLHEMGQPLHAFDADTIIGNKVIVRQAQANEIFVTLDNNKVTLQEGDIVIANASEAMCIAGVYGGANSGVKQSTTSIFLESAWFAPHCVRATSTRLGLRTDAATRFEKGVDVSQTRYALDRAISLLVEFAGATIASAVHDVYPTPLPVHNIKVSYSYINKLSGAQYLPKQINNILLHLCFSIIEQNSDGVVVQVPYAKPDVKLPADIVEEIMRIDGLNNIPFTGRINFAINKTNNNSTRSIKEKVAQYLTHLGYYELFTNSITNGKYYNEDTTVVSMLNSLSAELNVLRPSMLETGLQAVAFNINRKNTNLQLFEIGKVYHNHNGKYVETEELHLYCTGTKQAQHWQAATTPLSIFDIKATMQALLDKLNINATFNTISEHQVDIKIKKQSVGSITLLDKAKLALHDIKQAVWHVSCQWLPLCQAMPSTQHKYKPISKYMSAERDLALVMDTNITYADIKKHIATTNSTLLQELSVFDVYQGDNLGADKKQYAIRLIFNDASKTLTDTEVDAEVKKLLEAITKGTGAVLR